MATTSAASWRPEAQTFGRILLYQGDITRLDTAAIVNAANSSLLGGGGVDGAIHRAGGPAILAACRAIVAERGECPTGAAVLTTGGELPARSVIHTVGPVWQDGSQGEAGLLARCYDNCLRLAAENQLDSVAFPAISTGVYGYPKDKAARVAVQTVREFLATHELPATVVFVPHDGESRWIYEQELLK